jgi:hypothetical protein
MKPGFGQVIKSHALLVDHDFPLCPADWRGIEQPMGAYVRYRT